MKSVLFVDGFGFLQQFSELPQEATSHVKIVMLTSSLDPKDRERFISSPYVTDIIDKPLDHAKVRHLIDLL